MLTINPNLMPDIGTKFKPQNQINQNLNLNSISLSQLSSDTFTKTNNINFTGLFSKKPLPKLGNPATPEEIALLKQAIEQKEDIVWNWMMRQPKYSSYFNRLVVEKPRIEFTKQIQDPEKYKEGNISRYNWAENTIALNLSFLPNMALISNGNIALVSRDVATGFIRNTPGDVPYEDGFEDLGERSIGFALQSSEETGKSYFYRLSPEEAAELATQYLAQEMDRVMAFHVLLNTESIGAENELINKYYFNLKNNHKLQPNTTGFWIDTYPGEYKELDKVRASYPVFKMNGLDKWVINPDNTYENIPPITYRALYNDFIDTDNVLNHPKSPLELSGLIASKKFMDNYIPKGNNERERERLEIFYQVQSDLLNSDIEERIRLIKEKR